MVLRRYWCYRVTVRVVPPHESGADDADRPDLLRRHRQPSHLHALVTVVMVMVMVMVVTVMMRASDLPL
jgi:hypothetical protein